MEVRVAGWWLGWVGFCEGIHRWFPSPRAINDEIASIYYVLIMMPLHFCPSVINHVHHHRNWNHVWLFPRPLPHLEPHAVLTEFVCLSVNVHIATLDSARYRFNMVNFLNKNHGPLFSKPSYCKISLHIVIFHFVFLFLWMWYIMFCTRAISLYEASRSYAALREHFINKCMLLKASVGSFSAYPNRWQSLAMDMVGDLRKTVEIPTAHVRPYRVACQEICNLPSSL